MEEIVAGIREDELSALSLEILDYADRISEIFDRIDSCMERLPGAYQGPPSDKLMERYRSIQANYATVKNNLASYSDDLVTLINKMRENDKYLSSLFQELTNNTTAQLRANNFNLT